MWTEKTGQDDNFIFTRRCLFNFIHFTSAIRLADVLYGRTAWNASQITRCSFVVHNFKIWNLDTLYFLQTLPMVRLHSHWHEYQLRVIHMSKTRTCGAFAVACTSTNTCNSVAIKNWVKVLKYLEFLAKVYSNIAGNVVRNCLHQNYIISLLCNITCLLIGVA